MKYLKKTTALLLSVLLLFSAMVTGFTVTADGNTATITAAAVEAQAGANVDVPVTVDTTGLTAAIFTVTVDGLVVNSYAFGDDFKEVYTDVYNNEYTFAVTAKADADFAGTATVVTLNVAVPANAAAGTVLGVTVADATAADYAEAYVAVATANGSVTVKAATPDVPKCEHEWEIVNAVDATESNLGSIDFVCSVCGEEDHADVQYWSRHTFYKRNINMASQIELNFKIREDRFNDANLGNAAEAFAKITVNTDFGEEVSYVTGLENYEVTVNAGDNRNIRTLVVPLAAKQLVDEVTANTFIKVGDTWYSGAAKTETVVGLAQGLYSSIGDTEKTLYANLLTYGARAQEYFTYKVDTLADANLGDYAAYVTAGELTFDGSIEQTYSVADPEGDSSIRTYKYGLTMAAKTEANLRVRLDKYSPFPDISTVTAKLVYGVGDDLITTNVASSEFTFFESNATGDRYTFSYADVYPKCMRDDVTLTFYVNGVPTDNVVTFSIENVVAKVYSNASATEKSMYQAMMKYADSAKAHFG